MYKIMLVDDEENIIKSLKRTFGKQSNWDIESYTDPTSALKRANTCIFDAIISDCKMPGINGIEFLSEIKKLQPDSVRVILTGLVDVKTLMDAINKAGAFRFVPKPWDDEVLIQYINDGLRYRDILVEHRMLAEKVRDQEDELLKYKIKQSHNQ